MKTLTDLRRRLVIGARLETLAAPAGATVAGNGGTTFLASRLEPGLVRSVITVQTNGVTLQSPDGHRSFLDFPKAAELHFEDEDTFTVLDDSDPRCNRTYRFVKES
jgi:hypothetical protein